VCLGGFVFDKDFFDVAKNILSNECRFVSLEFLKDMFDSDASLIYGAYR
jgi:hypothetical protein